MSWGCQDGSKESNRRNLELLDAITAIRTPSSKIITGENGRINATKYKRANLKEGY